MKKTWNQHVVKKENKSLVQKIILNSSPISRTEIANVTGLNKGTVSSLVNDLLEEQLIYESGIGESSGGRRPVMLIFNQLAGYSIGIDIGVNYLLGILTDLKGNIRHEKTTKLSNLSFNEIEDVLYKTIDFLIDAAPPSPYGIIGIGIGVPGTIWENGEILLAPNLGWTNIKLKQILQEKYDLPIIIENEANAGAYGEKHFGVGKAYSNIVYISIGIGIGTGLIIKEQLYKGKHGFSGELGHMTIEVNGKQCKCGSDGCWELYASEQALLENARRLGISAGDDEELSLEYLLSLAETGHQETLKLFEEVANYIGVGLKNIINIFNPDQIIIGNRIASAEKWLQAPIHKQIDQTIGFHEDNLVFLDPATHSTALGLVAFAIEDFLGMK
ncbi:ROK family transcriptional regulator [Sporosarcina sp. G11-34]|uniref:ROK family transcriptional regulator n=1 Tax=Sporosarcina sp. G11-34 TaxID=2849605 RepID=UPI0022A9C1CD|nr:ROK family transcriptional regulator [Sporosarcina sp. G11-34]MCZ2258606.1 ROK family transcriptional regulator [Sporosarcina sp. G11-34]